LHEDQAIKFLLEKDFDIQSQCFYTGYTPLLAYFAAGADFPLDKPKAMSASDAIDAMVKAGADLTAVTPDKNSLVTLAAFHCPNELLEHIIKLARPLGNLIDQANIIGRTPLMNAVRRELDCNNKNNNPPDFLRLQHLVENSRNLDAQDSGGNTALHYAAECDRQRCTRTRDVSDYQDEYGWTPLSCMLLFAGARPDIRNVAGQTFYDLVAAPLRVKILTKAARARTTSARFGLLGLARQKFFPYTRSIIHVAKDPEAEEYLLRVFHTRVDQAAEAVRVGCQEDSAGQVLSSRI